MYRIIFVFIIFFSILFYNEGFAHSSDLGELKINKSDGRFVAELVLDRFLIDNILKNQPSEASLDESRRLLLATIGQQKPALNGLPCDFLSVDKKPNKGKNDKLSIVVSCFKTSDRSEYFTWNFPFLKNMPNRFQLMVIIAIPNHEETFVLTKNQIRLEFGNQTHNFFGFVQMGLCHIGACFDEWKDRNNHFQLADGVDHILFTLALVLSVTSLWKILKLISGFSLGHFIILLLSAYKIIHVHSKWIEVGIALSIAYVAWNKIFFKKNENINFFLTCVFGMIHGLGFANSLFDLELKKEEILTALIGFNTGIELGQIFFIFLFLLILNMAKKVSTRFEEKLNQSLNYIIFLISIYWIYYRSFV